MGEMTTQKALGTHDIARICHVTPPSVVRWIKEGKLPSFTTGGGHRRVWESDLLRFMKEHNIPVPPELGPRQLTFLVVDDEEVNRKFITRVLREAYPGAVIEEAADGFEAAHKVHTLLPALIVLDIQLPKVNGLKICEMIRSDPGLRGVKILAISGNNADDAAAQTLKAGADDFLGKPFAIDELLQRMKALLA